MNNSWTVFFMYKPYTSIHTTILTSTNDVDEDLLIRIAAEKIREETSIDVYELKEKLGGNDNFGSGWISVEDNLEATEEEVLSIGLVYDL